MSSGRGGILAVTRQYANGETNVEGKKIEEEPRNEVETCHRSHFIQELRKNSTIRDLKQQIGVFSEKQAVEAKGGIYK